MTEQVLNGIWNYYLTLEDDISNTSRYIEPRGQENAYSFEFAKILILACTELESVFKFLCTEITGEHPEGNIGKYKEIILGKYPRIGDAVVTVKRWGADIKPFSEWPMENFRGGAHIKKLSITEENFFLELPTRMQFMRWLHSISQFSILRKPSI